MHFIIIGILILLIFISFFLGRFTVKRTSKNKFNNTNMVNASDILPYGLHVSLLTNDEINFYKILLPVAEKHNLYISIKPRLADFIFVHDSFRSKPHVFRSLVTQIIAKNVNFLLCDKSSFAPVVAFELFNDELSDFERNERNAFIDKLFSMVGLIIFIIHNYDAYSLNQKIIDVLGRDKT